MRRVPWWLALALVAVTVGVAMPSSQPDAARRIVALERQVADLANVVRRGKPAANMRDLRDGELFDAADGQVPVYDASVGKWRPGTAGGASYALYEDSTGVSASSGSSTVVPFDTLVEDSGAHGITIGSPFAGVFTLPPGIYTVFASIVHAANATGYREVQLTGTVSIATITFPPKQRVPAVATASESTYLSVGAVVSSATGADQLYVYGLQTSGGALGLQGGSVSFLRH